MSTNAMTDDLNKRRRSKNLALGLVIGGLCFLFYLITIVKMSAQ